jgi:hypothetical protein
MVAVSARGCIVVVYLRGDRLRNVCLLPLYPGTVAYLAADAGQKSRGVASGWLGVLVLAGVLTLMTAVGLALYLLRRSFGTILPWLLPLLAAPVEHRFTHALMDHYGLLTRISGLLLVGIGQFGAWTELFAL